MIDDMNMTEQEYYSVFETGTPRGSINTANRNVNVWDMWFEDGRYQIPYSWETLPGKCFIWFNSNCSSSCRLLAYAGFSARST